jgi:hypothetical protein
MITRIAVVERAAALTLLCAGVHSDEPAQPEWLAADAVIAVQLPTDIAADAGALRVFIDHRDFTALASMEAPGAIKLHAATHWPSGERQVIVYRVNEEKWEEVHRQSVRILTSRGFQQASVGPKVELKVKSQPAEAHYRDASAPTRTDYTDLIGQGGLAWQLRRGSFYHAGAFNFVGASYRNEALRFGELGQKTPKVDLSDYRLDVGAAGLNLTVGHVAYGNHPLLLNQMGGRGATLSYKLGQRFDLSFNSMNGTAIVGYDDLLGYTSPEHRVNGATAGLELIGSRPGALRIEATYLDASLLNQVDFNAGEIPDAETSTGWGLRLSGATPKQRLRADLIWATSRYLNPFDPVLAQDGELQAVRSAQAEGRSADISVDLLQNSTAVSDSQPLTITVTAHHERVEPLYKTIGTFLSADQELNRGAITTQLGSASLQAQAARQEDNLGDIATLLKTRTDSLNAALLLPLPQWLAKAGGAWWPQLHYSWQNVHQLVINAPSVDDSGFAASQLPDQANDQHQLSLAWSGGAWNVSYSLSIAEQDNRQLGREHADLRNTAHQLSYGQQLPGGFGFTLALTRARNFNVEQNIANYTTGGSMDVQWRPNDKWSVALNASVNRNDDSLDLARSDADTGFAQVNRSLTLPFNGHRVPCQVFVRYARQESASRDNVFDFSTRAINWTVDAGLSMGLF